jgi:hypothetical protein
MAAATADRIERNKKLHPVGVKHSAPLGEDVVIYAGTLFALWSDGKFYNLNALPGSGTLVRVLYTHDHLEAGVPSPGMHEGSTDVPVADGYSGLEVYLDCTSLTTTNVGGVAYATDDHTVRSTSGAGSIAAVGRIQTVFAAANYCTVLVDGMTRDLAL